jgi:hypothetical protein
MPLTRNRLPCYGSRIGFPVRNSVVLTLKNLSNPKKRGEKNLKTVQRLNALPRIKIALSPDLTMTGAVFRRGGRMQSLRR